MRLAPWVLAILVAACGSLPPAEPRPLGPGEAELVRHATAAMDLGDPDAGAAIDELVRQHPDLIDTRRLAQIRRGARGEDWRIYAEARANAAERPDADALYLYARTIPDRDEQARLFTECLELEPSSYFASFGLSVAEMSRGRAATAAEMAGRALAIRPGDPDARCLLASARAALDPAEDGERAWRELISAEPGWPRAVLGAADFFARRGDAPEAARVVLEGLGRRPGGPAFLAVLANLLDAADLPELAVRGAEAVGGGSALPCVVRAAAARALGSPRAAFEELSRAVRGGASPLVLAAETFETAVLSGEYAAASERFRAGLPSLALAPDNEERAKVEELSLALTAAAGAPGEGAIAVRLARALSAAGFNECATAVAARALAGCPADAGVQGLAADTASWSRFLAAVREHLARCYREAARESRGPELAEVLESLRSISLRLLGVDAFAGMEEHAVPFAGRILRTDTAPEWRRRGTLLVLGQRAGGPVEAKLLRIVAVLRGRLVEEEPYDLVLAEGGRLSSFRERGGDAVGGFTLPGFVTLDVAVARRWAEEARRLRSREGDAALWPAENDGDRSSLWFPGSLERDLARRARVAGVDAALAAVLAHEEGHVLDAARFYPPVARLPAVIAELVATGFSAARIEENLEERAERRALAAAADPAFSLTETVTWLGRDERGSAYAAAYRRIAERKVAGVLGAPGRYPSVDTSYNVLQQIGRLTEAELSALLATLAD